MAKTFAAMDPTINCLLAAPNVAHHSDERKLPVNDLE